MQIGNSQFEEVLKHASPGGIAEWRVRCLPLPDQQPHVSLETSNYCAAYLSEMTS